MNPYQQISWLRGAAIVALLALTPPHSAAQETDPAFRRAAHLRHGINTSGWFAQSPKNYSVDRLRTYTTTEDFDLIHHLGFDHIRLSVDPDPLTAWQRGIPQGAAFVAELDRTILAATSRGLAVVLDIHPEGHYKQELIQAGDGMERFTSLWKAVADHFKTIDPDLVFFEIMNEPEQPDAARWSAIEGIVAQAVRSIASQHTIIATGARWSGLDDLLLLEPLPLQNVIYTFHDYEPFAFTHQGATWTSPEVRPLRGVPYPSTPEVIEPLLSQEPNLAAQYWLEQYGLARWDATRVDHTLEFAEQWSRAHHAPVYCGEFGVHRPFAPPADRALWLHDMRLALEKHGIGWAMWDYQENFGLVTKRQGKATPDPLLVEALGLHPVTQ